MQNNFDLKKFLVENKLTPTSQATSTPKVKVGVSLKNPIEEPDVNDFGVPKDPKAMASFHPSEDELRQMMYPNDSLDEENTEDENEWDLGDLGDEWNVKLLQKGDVITRDMGVDGVEDYLFPFTIKGFSRNAVLIQILPKDKNHPQWVDYKIVNYYLKPEYRIARPL